MKPEHQQLHNQIRLGQYRAKQTEPERIKSVVAQRVDNYGKKLNLNFRQRGVAIKLAKINLEFGGNDEAAYNTGKDAAWLIAQHSIVDKLTNRRRYPEHLH